MYSVDVFVLHLSISIFSYFILTIHFIADAITVLLYHYIYLRNILWLVTFQRRITNTKYSVFTWSDIIHPRCEINKSLCSSKII